jgi:hypothetical protein
VCRRSEQLHSIPRLKLLQFAEEDVAELEECGGTGPLAVLLAAVILEGDGAARGETGDRNAGDDEPAVEQRRIGSRDPAASMKFHVFCEFFCGYSTLSPCPPTSSVTSVVNSSLPRPRRLPAHRHAPARRRDAYARVSAHVRQAVPATRSAGAGRDIHHQSQCISTAQEPRPPR